MNLSCFEILGIYCAKNFGARQYGKCSENLYNGFVFSSFFMVFYFLIFFYCEEILLMIKIAPENAYLTSKMVKYCIPGALLQTVNDQFKAFIMSQQITEIFGWTNLLALVLNVFGGYMLVLEMGYGVTAFGICKLFTEVMNLVVIIYLMVYKVHRETLCKPNPKKLFDAEFTEYAVLG